VIWIEPIPTSQGVGLGRLFGIDDQEIVPVRDRIHPTNLGQILGALRATMQHQQEVTVLGHRDWVEPKVYTYASRMYCSRCRLPISRHDGAITLYGGRGCGRFVSSPLNAGTTLFISWNELANVHFAGYQLQKCNFRNAVEAGFERRPEVIAAP
jgi:hypothetical protein